MCLHELFIHSKHVACVNLLFYIMPSDDRPVRDSERKAALMHFDSSQVSESTAYCEGYVQLYTRSTSGN